MIPKRPQKHVTMSEVLGNRLRAAAVQPPLLRSSFHTSSLAGPQWLQLLPCLCYGTLEAKSLLLML